jgi:hypothetical protein
MNHRSSRLVALTTALSLLAACGGGGGAAGGVANVQPAAQTGRVTVSLSDGIIRDYDQVLMEISEIRFIASGGQDILVLESPVTVDFLALQNFSEVLLRREVVSGTYAKIRLILASLKLVKLDAAGNVASEDNVRLNGLRKVDINPRGPFTVRAGQDLVIDIEIDLDKSIHVVGAGQSRNIRFRPVIFAAIHTQAAFDKLFRIEGRIDAVNAAAGTFRVCDLRRAFLDGVNRPNPADVCVLVDPDGDTPFFDFEAQPDSLGFGGLAVNDAVVVYGKFDALAAGDRLVPAVVASGPSGTVFDRRRGIAASEYDTVEDDFYLGRATDNCQIDPDPLRVVVAPGAPAFFEDDADPENRARPVDLEALPLLCLRTEVEGRLDASSSPPTPFLRAFVVLLGGSVAGREELVGVLSERAATPATDDYDLDLTGSSVNEIVVVSDATRIVKITSSGGSELIEELTSVPTGNEVVVYGTRGEDGVVAASFILWDAT